MQIKVLQGYILQLIAAIRPERMGTEQVGQGCEEREIHVLFFFRLGFYELTWILKIKKYINAVAFSLGIFFHYISQIIFKLHPCPQWVPAGWITTEVALLGSGLVTLVNKLRRARQTEPSFLPHWNLEAISHFFIRTDAGLKARGLRWSIPNA